MRRFAPVRRSALEAATLLCAAIGMAAYGLWPLAGVLLAVAHIATMQDARRRHIAERECAISEAKARERAGGRRLNLALVESLATAVEAKIGCNLGHLARVKAYAADIARVMGADPETTDALESAACLHEIGRLGVPDNLIGQPGSLTLEERDKARAYPLIGERILAPVPFAGPVCAIVRHHQERYDGKGYPFGLAGDDIPLGARILAVADSYDTLVSAHAGRPGLGHEEALSRLKAGSGSQFDPAAVAAFEAVVDHVNERLADCSAPGAGLLPGSTHDIARAQKEVVVLQTLSTSVGATLDLNTSLESLIGKVRDIIPCSLCVVYLLEPDGRYLRANVVSGVNESYFEDSRAQVGTYLTGRAVSRGKPVRAGFVLDDILASPCVSPWTQLRSTLVAPLVVDGRVIGTINVYHEDAEALSADHLRLLTLIGEMAGRGVENARLFAQTQETAFTDPLTGLRNARYLRHCLEQEVNRARKNGHRVAVLGMDLDQFKPVNDTYGHERGDELLREIGRLLLRQVRNYDVLARYAGDEFVLVLPETEREEAEIVARKVQRAMDRLAADLRSREPGFPSIGISTGVAVYPDDADSLEGLLACADQAMYDDKRSRRLPRAA